MTAPTTTRSAFPPAVDDLMPKARQLVATLDGEIPSRNRLMKEFRIGSPKATALRDALTAIKDKHTDALQLWTMHTKRGASFDPPRSPWAAADRAASLEPVTDPPLLHLVTDAEQTPTLTPDTAIAATDHAEVVTPVDVPADPARRPVTWPVFLLCLPAFVAIWGGWVEMGRLTGFGMVKLLPGIADSIEINTAITLPIGVETYAAYALFVWLSGRATGDARTFAKRSALGSLGLGALGQVAFHLMNAWGWAQAPWPITAAVACIPVAVLGMGATLTNPPAWSGSWLSVAFSGPAYAVLSPRSAYPHRYVLQCGTATHGAFAAP